MSDTTKLVVAGNRAQFEMFIDKLRRKGKPTNNYVCIVGVESLRGRNGASQLIVVGTAKDRADYSQIIDECNSRGIQLPTARNLNRIATAQGPIQFNYDAIEGYEESDLTVRYTAPEGGLYNVTYNTGFETGETVRLTSGDSVSFGELPTVREGFDGVLTRELIEEATERIRNQQEALFGGSTSDRVLSGFARLQEQRQRLEEEHEQHIQEHLDAMRRIIGTNTDIWDVGID
jgi:hypothetical protein